MATTETNLIALGGSLIELLAACVITFYVARALLSIPRDRTGDRARLLVAEGVLTALSFSVAGTLLKTIALESWPQIRLFAFVLLLRTVLKRVFAWEQRLIAKRHPA